jgi:hypothetical protein
MMGLVTHHISLGGQIGDCLWLSHSALDILGVISRRDLLKLVIHLGYTYGCDALVGFFKNCDALVLVMD